MNVIPNTNYTPLASHQIELFKIGCLDKEVDCFPRTIQTNTIIFT